MTGPALLAFALIALGAVMIVVGHIRRRPWPAFPWMVLLGISLVAWAPMVAIIWSQP